MLTASALLWGAQASAQAPAKFTNLTGEKQWMKQFRTEVGQCLDRASQPR